MSDRIEEDLIDAGEGTEETLIAIGKILKPNLQNGQGFALFIVNAQAEEYGFVSHNVPIRDLFGVIATFIQRNQHRAPDTFSVQEADSGVVPPVWSDDEEESE